MIASLRALPILAGYNVLINQRTFFKGGGLCSCHQCDTQRHLDYWHSSFRCCSISQELIAAIFLITSMGYRCYALIWRWREIYLVDRSLYAKLIGEHQMSLYCNYLSFMLSWCLFSHTSAPVFIFLFNLVSMSQVVFLCIFLVV